MMDFKNIILKLYLLSMSILIFSLVIYLRLFIKRYDYSLLFLKNNLTIYHILFSSFFILLHFFILCYTCYLLYKTLTKKITEEKIIITYLKKLINKLYWEPLEYLNNLLAPHIPYSGTFIIFYIEFYKKHSGFLMKSLAFMFYFLPKIILASVFFIEIIWFNKIYYFIKLLYLLLIPIIYKIFLKLCCSFFENNIEDVTKYLTVTPLGEPNINGVYYKFDIQFKPEYAHHEKDLPEFVENWFLLFYLLNYTQIIKDYINNSTSYITLFTSTLYFSAGFYKLLYLLNFL